MIWDNNMNMDDMKSDEDVWEDVIVVMFTDRHLSLEQDKLILKLRIPRESTVKEKVSSRKLIEIIWQHGAVKANMSQ